MLISVILLLLLHAYFLYLRFGHGFRAARLELFNAAGNVDQFLFARVERVTLGADLHFDLLFGGAHRERVAARADDVRLGEIGRMNIFFHMLEIIARRALLVKLFAVYSWADSRVRPYRRKYAPASNSRSWFSLSGFSIVS